MTIYALREDSNAVNVDVLDVIGKGLLTRGVTADAVVASLRASRPRNINVRVNSAGGSVPEATAIRSVLAERAQAGAKVNVQVIGLAASAATIVVDAGTDVAIARGAFFMVHEAAAETPGRGTADDHRRAQDVLRAVNDNMVSMYTAGSARRGRYKTADDFRGAMKRETYFTANEAVAWGLADRVIDEVRVAACADITRLKAPPATLVVAYAILEKGTTSMELTKEQREVCRLTGVTEDAFRAELERQAQAAAPTLEASEQRICELLGITPEAYAAEKSRIAAAGDSERLLGAR